MAYHKMVIIGRLVGEPRLNTFAGGKVAKFGLPVDFTRRKKNPETGEWEGDSFIMDVDAFSRDNGQQLADIVMQYLHKGSQVYVEGRVKLNEYVNREGVKVSKTVMVADVIQFLDRPGEGGPGDGAQRGMGSAPQRPPTPATQKPMAKGPAAPSAPAYDEESDLPPSGENDSEIPF